LRGKCSNGGVGEEGVDVCSLAGRVEDVIECCERFDLGFIGRRCRMVPKMGISRRGRTPFGVTCEISIRFFLAITRCVANGEERWHVKEWVTAVGGCIVEIYANGVSGVSDVESMMLGALIL